MTTTILQNSFLPTQISACALWLDGKDTSAASMTLSGTTVITWKDKSGVGANAASVNSPQLLSSGGVSFNGSQYFTLSAPYSQTSSVFMVATGQNSTSVAGGQYYWNFNNTNQGGNIINNNTNFPTGPLVYYDNVNGASGYFVIGNTLVNPFLASVVQTPGTNVVGYYNGLQAFTRSYTAGTASAISVIGAAVNGASPPFLINGNIYEFILYNAALTTAQRQQVEGYLAQKWGLQASLPSNHPYKYSAYFTNQAYVSTIVSPTVTNRFTNASFLPTSIPGCELWLDAADPNANGVLPVNGSSVSTWKDKSSTANNMSLTSGTVTYNSVTKAVNFPNGGNGIMTSVKSSTVTASQSVVFVVCQATALTTDFGYVFLCTNISTSPGDYSIRFLTTTTTLCSTNHGDIGYGTAYYVNGTLGVPSGSPNQTIPLLSGANIIYGLFNASGTTSFALSSSYYSRYFVGNIQEILLYTGPITTTQRQQVEGYLAWKWGLQVNLPPTHPYKNTSAVFATQPTTLAILGANPYNNTIVFRYFNPTSIAGTQLWLDAADPSVVIKSGTTVTAWNDKSGNGNNGTASGSPVLLANSINGSYPSIYFDGASSIAGTTVNSGTTLTAFCILQTTDANLNTNGRLLSLSSPGRNDYDNVQSCIAYDQFNNAQINTNRGNRGTVQVVYNVPVGTSALVATIFYGNTSNTFYGNGSLEFTSTDPSWNQNFSITTYCIGNAINPNGAWYKGRIGEIILYSTALSSQQRQQVEGYLAWKWGLQANLPPTHLYKNYPPSP